MKSVVYKSETVKTLHGELRVSTIITAITKTSRLFRLQFFFSFFFFFSSTLKPYRYPYFSFYIVPTGDVDRRNIISTSIYFVVKINTRFHLPKRTKSLLQLLFESYTLDCNLTEKHHDPDIRTRDYNLKKKNK